MAEEKSATEQINEIKNKALIKNKQYKIVYDAFGEGLEPAYYWILDFMRETLGYKIEKTYDQFVASEASGFFSELGGKRTIMEKRAMEIMQTLGVIVKSVLQLLWDLREFELRLDHYDKLDSSNKEEVDAANNALKAIWLTEVDIKKGRGSVNLLAQELHFVNLRDAFMVAESVEDVKKMDLNDRVKRILKYKIKEYLDWRKRSEKELKKRYKIEKAWLKSQVNAMRLYSKWARPYLLATKKLFPAESLETGMEDIVTAFDVMRIDLEIRGRKEINTVSRPGKHPKVIIPKKTKVGKDLYEDERIYSIIEVEFRFRTSPMKTSPPGKEAHYTHRGRIDMFFRPYVFTGAELKKLKELEEDEVLQYLEGMTTESLSAMREDLKKYMEEPTIDEIKKKLSKLKMRKEKLEYLKGIKEVEDPEIEKEVKKRLKQYEIKLPFVEGMKDLLEPLTGVSKTLQELQARRAEKPKIKEWDIKRLKTIAKKKVSGDIWMVYKIYKQAHGMMKW
ncbi:hypothetical protein GF374_00445 [Candidatus Woesearchaeota archaeon]|nr:hypothetical protein [Candidatus Woesearchaeota archaeon]